MAKLTQQQTTTLINHYFKTIESIPPRLGMKMSNALNDLMKVRFQEPIVNERMFRMEEYECAICCGLNNKMHVDFYQIKRYKKPKDGKTHMTQFSHKLEFDVFCYRYCNPWMAFVFEKVAFDIA